MLNFQSKSNQKWKKYLWWKFVMRSMIWYHLYNLKNVKNIHGGMLLLVKLQTFNLQLY